MGRPLLLLLLALGLAACSTPGKNDQLTHERVVINAPEQQGRKAPKKPPEWFDEQIALAMDEQRDGKIREALERIRAARRENPGDVHAADLATLLGQLNQAVLELATLVGWVVPEKEPIVFGEEVRVRIRLRNPGERHIRVPARLRKTSPSVFVFELLRRDYDTRGQIINTRRRLHSELEDDLDIPPGTTAEIVLSLGLSGNDQPLAGFRTFTIAGRLRASVTDIGGLQRFEAIPIDAGTLRSFRPNYEHLADDPLKRIGQAIEKDAYVHLLTAAGLVVDENRRDAVDVLVAGLGARQTRDWAIFACLQYLTGIEMARDADAWRAWWPRHRESFFVPKPAKRKPGKEVPVFD